MITIKHLTKNYHEGEVTTKVIRDLDLRKPIYQQLAAYGHFGRDDLNLTWERTNKVNELRAAIGL